MFFLSQIALIYSLMSLREIKSLNSSKDKVIFIRTDITLVASSQPTNFDETSLEVDVQKIFSLRHLFSLQNIFQETRLYYSEIGSDICLNSPKRGLKRK